MGKAIWRHERKFLPEPRLARQLRERIAAVLPIDPNGRNGYRVLNLYFDDLYQTALYEKYSGCLLREKWRVRHYNGELSTLRLECKQKRGEYIHKDSVKVTPEQYAALCRGEPGFAAERSEPLWQRFYARCTAGLLKPVLTADYRREAFIYEPGNVRVTFDSGLTASRAMHGQPGARHEVLPPGQLILELKYDEFCPSVVLGLLDGIPLAQTAVSKFVLACENLNGRRQYAIGAAGYFGGGHAI